MGRLAIVGALLLLGALFASPLLPQVGSGSNVLAVGGGTSEYFATFQNVDGQAQTIKVLLHLPAGTTGREPLPVLVALHGYGGNGEAFSRPLLEATDRLGWAVVAPTIAYGDWHDPEAVCRDARDDLPGLRAVLEDLPRRTGLRLEPRALLYGFSRGAQYAHRFALAYPEKVAGVAAMGAGP
ncbi:MAG: alpha/beta fold hydrolase, partial [Chloroflexota bacterium]